MLPESHKSSLFFSDNRKTVALLQKRKKYTGNNINEKYYYCYMPDKMYSNESKACDYLLYNDSIKNVYFIELKGSDVLKAVDQIVSSIKLYGQYFNDYTINARIVPSRVNTLDLKTAKVVSLEKRIHLTGGTFKKQVNELKEYI